jgi:hypothetical protein
VILGRWDLPWQQMYIHRHYNLKSHLICCVFLLTKFWPLTHQTILFVLLFNWREFRSGYFFLPAVPVSVTSLAYCCSAGSSEVWVDCGEGWDGVLSWDPDFWLYLPSILWSCTRFWVPSVLLSSAQCRAAQNVSSLLTWTLSSRKVELLETSPQTRI